MGDVQHSVLVTYWLHDDPDWTCVNFIEAGETIVREEPHREEQKEAKDLFDSDSDDEPDSYAQLLIPGELFKEMSGRLPIIPYDHNGDNCDIDEIEGLDDEPPTYILYVSDIEFFKERRLRGTSWSILPVLDFELVVAIFETGIDHGCCHQCNDG